MLVAVAVVLVVIAGGAGPMMTGTAAAVFWAAMVAVVTVLSPMVMVMVMPVLMVMMFLLAWNDRTWWSARDGCKAAVICCRRWCEYSSILSASCATCYVASGYISSYVYV
jgi:hypothetical protein